MHELTFLEMDFGLAVLPNSRGDRPKSRVRMDIGPKGACPMSMCMEFIQVILSQNRRCRGSWGTWGTSAPYKAFGMLKKKIEGEGREKKRGGYWEAYRGTTCPKCPRTSFLHSEKTCIMLITKRIGVLSTSGARSRGT